MQRFNLLFSVLTVIASAVLCQQLVADSIANQRDKNDYAELNHVKYGLLSIDEWKRQVTAILAGEIDKLYLSRANEKVLRQHVETLLNALIDKVDQRIRKEHAESAGGRLTQSLIDLFIDLDSIKKGIPEYTDAVIHEVKKAKTRRQVKVALNEQLKRYSELTFASRDRTALNRILLRTGSGDAETARARLGEEIVRKQALIAREAALLIMLAVIVFALSGLDGASLPQSRYICLVLVLLILLFAGVTTPTIDMEARIARMSFMLLGYPVHFENQMLYFQSKSILDVFRIMIALGVQMKLVGIMLVTFSVIFPLLKIAATMGFYFDYRRARSNPLVRFFVLHSGKWSMADVMVVAIFMAYIGFDGIIANQLEHLNAEGEELVLLTTNGTSLQPGFYLFLTYTLLALLLPELLARKHREEERVAVPAQCEVRGMDKVSAAAQCSNNTACLENSARSSVKN
ncbi:MAG TPA: paraquat-inducible protein A [Sideroxyarcus sp.]|nr:paraquat-inducible protein A [Sideroxyarcus sp.]